MMKTDRRLGIAIATICLLGLGVAGYLSYTKLFGTQVQCIAGEGCSIVQKSKYAEFIGIPVPYIGFVGWIGVLVTLLIPGDLGRGATALFTVFGFFFTLYLTYLEIWVIEAICQWCVANGVLMTIAAVLAVWRLIVYTPPGLVAATAAGPDEELVADDGPDAEAPAGQNE